ncbi:hypothetical protein NCCP2222_19030 [Sporosarcina sp. NCCP-2222]|uniref:hypothetical protein n=1 Tax=Sporosarcina sp. NCCP-2222 TaxID=2935073 RepID=UPI00207F2B0A|nr:hypothetical protein [Sporosarcina sp. NCCP-2222]GKV55956.1 hypothetical protein NCCP2222_19030 [Sporosarcina sp. NCCP-2222]
MYAEIIKHLDGEFVTLFESEDEDLNHATILVTSNEMRKKDELVFLNFYMLADGDLSHGLATFGFDNASEAWEFLKKVPDMSAIDFMSQALGMVPRFEMVD